MIIIDTETTGLPEPSNAPLAVQPQIIDICAIKLDDNTLEEVDCYSELINPQKELPEIITKITGITDAELEGEQPFVFHYAKLCDLFLGERILIAHNLDFDGAVLGFELSRIGKLLEFPWPPRRICTVEATFGIKGHRLKMSDLYAHCHDGATFKGAHRAEADTRALASCIRWLAKEGVVELP